jgi:hypothetical protein
MIERKTMNAHEARKITQENLNGDRIAPFLEIIYGRIRKAATEGKSEISRPFYNMRPFPHEAQERAILDRLRNEGYKVAYHGNCDPRDQRESPYHTISW